MNEQAKSDGVEMPPFDQLRVAVDFDGTFTASPALFCQLIGMMKKYGADVRFVTFRFRTGNNSDILSWGERLEVPVIFTEGRQKESFCAAQDWEPTFWIDDDPRFIPSVDGLELLIQGCKLTGG